MFTGVYLFYHGARLSCSDKGGSDKGGVDFRIGYGSALIIVSLLAVGIIAGSVLALRKVNGKFPFQNKPFSTQLCKNLFLTSSIIGLTVSFFLIVGLGAVDYTIIKGLNTKKHEA